MAFLAKGGKAHPPKPSPKIEKNKPQCQWLLQVLNFLDFRTLQILYNECEILL